MQSSHAAAKVSVRFDDPNLVAYGGLKPVVRLAERCGLPAMTDELVRLPVSKDGTGAFPAAKLMPLVGGVIAGADNPTLKLIGRRPGAAWACPPSSMRTTRVPTPALPALRRASSTRMT